ncbi:MAG: cytochrome c [Oligoflexia bacterium]|nr:cytochrome c [Oligoflexia bacterium]
MKLVFTLAFLLSTTTFAKSRGEELFNLCMSCHGQQGYGNHKVGAPAIAGLPKWYITKQLTIFASGGRGKHPDDDAGNRMRPMARTLTPEDIKDVADYVSILKPQTPEKTLHGDLEKGKALFVVCAACHGQNGDGNEVLHAPTLKISNDWYLVTQLKNFKNKIRGADAVTDAFGATMSPMAATLPDEEAMKNVITYVQSLKQ